jgi:large subunit ribosomal protein L10
MKRAVDGMSGIEDLTPYFKEQIGLVFVSDKIAEVAKILTDFSKEHQALKLVAGCVEETVVPKEKISAIASLPPREVLLAQVCGTIKAPISNFANVLNMQVLRLLWTLKQVEQKKQ